MSNDLVETAFSTFVQNAATTAALPEFANVNYYTSGEKGTFKLPCVSFEMKEAVALPVANGPSQGPLTVWIETQADDETEIEHNARCTAVRSWLRDTRQASLAMTGQTIRVFGFAPTGTSRELKGNHWTSGLDFTVGFSPLA